MAVLELSAEMEERARSLHQRALIFDACFSTPGFFKEEEREIQAFVDGGIGGGLATVAEEEHNFAKAVDSIEVRWPSGKKQIVRGPFKLNSLLDVREQ